jgi:hypothetical protein
MCERMPQDTFVSPAGDGDIWILDGFQPPRTLWERLWQTEAVDRVDAREPFERPISR